MSNTKIKFILVLLFVLIGSSFIITSQITTTQTQVLDLAERARDYFIEATKGNIVGQETGNKFGENLVVGTTLEDIQSQGGILDFLQSAELINIISSDTVNDIVGGANATSIFIEGLDSNFIEISEVVNLSAGSTNTTQQYIRVNKMVVNEVGNYTNSNEGTITATAAVSSTVQIEIPAGEGTSKTSHFTVPVGQNLIITAFRITMDTGKEVDIFLKARANADDTLAPMSPVRTFRDFIGLSTPIAGESKGNLKFDEKTDIWFTGITSTGTSQIEINYDFIQYAIGS